jgi:hypothetical protein
MARRTKAQMLADAAEETKKVVKSARTGKFVPKADAETKPAETVTMKVRRAKKHSVTVIKPPPVVEEVVETAEGIPTVTFIEVGQMQALDLTGVPDDPPRAFDAIATAGEREF